MINTSISRLFLIGCFCISMCTIRAQYVSIPDSNFGTWLYNNGFSACLTGNNTTGWQLDTSCGPVQTDTLLNCYTSNISDLSGISYFHSLLHLDCSSNHLISLPTLPASLTDLKCYGNHLSSLPVLPASLIQLDCNDNNLSVLPVLPVSLLELTLTLNPLSSLPVLPASLRGLTCDNDNLSSLPALPASLTSLSCNSNNLSSLPTLPASLIQLSCVANPLSNLPTLPVSLGHLYCAGDTLLLSLPALPASLVYLDCSFGLLTSLPTLPPLLTNLYCYNNQLSSLPILPTSLWELDCSNNNLSNLPTLPASLGLLDCSHNNLGSLPALPQPLTSFSCAFNPNLTCLPRIYSNFTLAFYMSGTAIHCLPNRFHVSAVNYDVNPDTMPLCTPGSGCDFYYNIAGNIHQDTVADCTGDSLQPGANMHNIKVMLARGGQVQQQFYAFGSGGYSFKTDSLVNYEILIDTTNLSFSVVCPVGNMRAVTLSTTDSVEMGQDFGLKCAVSDYAVTSIYGRFRKAHTSHVSISAGDFMLFQYGAACGNGTSGTVTTTLSGPVSYAGPAPGALTPASVSGQVLTYTISNLDSLLLGSLDIMVATDSNAVLGTPVCITTIISPAIPDINPGDDTLTICDAVVNSLDPNHKGVSPAQEAPGSTDWLTYTVDFQNTGNDTAYTVVVRDTLSSNLDAASFQYLASDHKAVIQLFGRAIVFTFPTINLVDSATNAPKSTGWIQYRVRPNANLPQGTQINNTAYIYFDNNPAVITNTAQTQFNNTTGINPDPSHAVRQAIQVFPNPNVGMFTLYCPGYMNTAYTISDMLGHVVARQSISADRQTIDIGDVGAGVYTLSVDGAQPVRITIVK